MKITKKQWCEFDAKYGLTIDLAFMGIAAILLILKWRFESLPSSLNALSTLTILGLLMHTLAREFLPNYCRDDVPPPSTTTTTTTVPTTTTPESASVTPAASESQPQPAQVADVPLPQAPSTAAPAAPAAPAALAGPLRGGNALAFWGNVQGLQGRRVEPPRCGRGYAHHIPQPIHS